MSSTASMANSSFLVNLIIFARTDTPSFPGMLAGLSPRKRVGTSGLDAGRPEPGLPAAPLPRKRRHDRKIRLRDTGKDQLGDTVARPDLDWVTALHGIAVPCRDEAGPLVIGIDDADCVAENQPALVAQPGPRQHECAPFGVANAKGDAGRDEYSGRLRLNH